MNLRAGAHLEHATVLKEASAHRLSRHESSMRIYDLVRGWKEGRDG